MDAVRAGLARDLLEQFESADDDPDLGEALDRWELSLFQNEPFRSEQLRAAAGALLGETWPLRGVLVLGDDDATRERVHKQLVALEQGAEASQAAADAIRRLVVATLRSGDRGELRRNLDRQLLGLEPRQRLRTAV